MASEDVMQFPEGFWFLLALPNRAHRMEKANRYDLLSKDVVDELFATFLGYRKQHLDNLRRKGFVAKAQKGLINLST
jgi:hypothetical protein